LLKNVQLGNFLRNVHGRHYRHSASGLCVVAFWCVFRLYLTYTTQVVFIILLINYTLLHRWCSSFCSWAFHRTCSSRTPKNSLLVPSLAWPRCVYVCCVRVCMYVVSLSLFLSLSLSLCACVQISCNNIYTYIYR